MEAKGLMGKECRTCDSYVKVGFPGALLRELWLSWVLGLALPSMFWAACTFPFLLCPHLAQHPQHAGRQLLSCPVLEVSLVSLAQCLRGPRKVEDGTLLRAVSTQWDASQWEARAIIHLTFHLAVALFSTVDKGSSKQSLKLQEHFKRPHIHSETGLFRGNAV